MASHHIILNRDMDLLKGVGEEEVVKRRCKVVVLSVAKKSSV